MGRAGEERDDRQRQVNETCQEPRSRQRADGPQSRVQDQGRAKQTLPQVAARTGRGRMRADLVGRDGRHLVSGPRHAERPAHRQED